MMKAILHKAIFTAVGLMVTLPCGSANALPPPGTYEKLKREARVVLQLRVLKIQKTLAGGGWQYCICDARVVAVGRSAAGHKKGDIIQFETFYMISSVDGPAPPPRLWVGWYGRVYLDLPGEPRGPTNLDDDSEILRLAADGESFEKLRRIRPFGRR